ncbi:CheR family methyltransferase [Undibacterium pigrum]|uniref:Chemotaxis protein methyltransferase CheR n=1 Tax=Undibacterium pigrum TaxID=401470 RepID=A0A318JGU8_9BURK|nr:CheR family methyltransferase [Undibacterium pigrum]PXX47727.1 chemotaxis protein methyltransferase CheR [Undibacterium pigrum]
MNVLKVEEIELDMLLEAIYRYRGDDFRGFDRQVLADKFIVVMKQYGIKTYSALQDSILHDSAHWDAVLRTLLLCPVALFDEPQRLQFLRNQLSPWLRSHAHTRIWIADCSSIEEIYTLVILLEEEQVCDKATIYITCSNDLLLQEMAGAGLALEKFSGYEKNYLQSGGRSRLLDYFQEKSGYLVLRDGLQKNLIWSQFSLVTDTSFNEFELISCRKALASFDVALRHRALRLFAASLTPFGMLDADLASYNGSKANLTWHYQAISDEFGLYRHHP